MKQKRQIRTRIVSPVRSHPNDVLYVGDEKTRQKRSSQRFHADRKDGTSYD